MLPSVWSSLLNVKLAAHLTLESSSTVILEYTIFSAINEKGMQKIWGPYFFSPLRRKNDSNNDGAFMVLEIWCRLTGRTNKQMKCDINIACHARFTYDFIIGNITYVKMYKCPLCKMQKRRQNRYQLRSNSSVVLASTGRLGVAGTALLLTT